MLQLNKQVGELFYRMIEPIQGMQLFCNTLDSCRDVLELVHDYNIRIATVTNQSNTKLYYANLGDRAWDVKCSDDIGLFLPQDQYHLSFSFPNFNLSQDDNNENLYLISPEYSIDRLMIFECSSGKEQRKVETHLIAAEAVLNATIAGGFFGIVLPKKWIGKNMKFHRWWEENAACVSKIKLSSDAITHTVDGNILNAPGEWYLYTYQRPAFAPNLKAMQSTSFSYGLEFARFRYTQFIYSVNDLSDQEIDKCVVAFKTSRTSDWYKNSIKLWKKLVSKNNTHAWCSLVRYNAIPLKSPEGTWFFEPTNKCKPKEKVIEKKDEVKEVQNAVQIKPGPPVKLAAYNVNAKLLLEDFYKYNNTILDEIRTKGYSEIREELLRRLREFSLIPCITSADIKKEKKTKKWLEIQLTPIERIIPVHGKEAIVSDSDIDKNGNGNGDNNNNGDSWEMAYEEIGMHETHPELVRLWKQRAMKMNLHKSDICYGYQFNDLVVQACKQSNLNGNVMGLGKTREALLLPLLKCTKHTLIVVPSGLIGEWQDEIENTIMPYARTQRVDWQGNKLIINYRVIQWAEDILDRPLVRYTIIGYDKLKAVPRDGSFFRCPECEQVVYSVKAKDRKQPCPVCNESKIKNWKEQCREKGLRKHKVDSTGKKVHWDSKDAVRIVDDRPSRPGIVYMKKQKQIWKKMKKVKSGYTYNDVTGERTPKFKLIERKTHVKWTFAELLRHRFGMIIGDEATYFKNSDSKRAKAVKHLRSRSKILLTGTPMKGFPQNVLEILNWAFKSSIFPNYRSHDSAGYRRFLDKYSTDVEILKPNGSRTKKQLPKINNPELFQSEMAPLMLRHTRNEPDILACIPKKHIDHKIINVDMDSEHKAYYEKWLEKFAEWWQMMKEEEERKRSGQGGILPKLGYLKNASTIPHFMLNSILAKKKDKTENQRLAMNWARLIGRYQENKTPKTNIRKVEVAREIALKAVARGDKVIIFSSRTKNLDLGKAWADRKGIGSLVVDGRSPTAIKKGSNRSQRHELVDKFRHYADYNIMWAGLDALKEGMNIPEANWGIFLDYTWNYTDWKQALGRMIRPQQTKTVHARFIIHHETIDGYMAAWCLLKEKSSEEGIDYMQFSDFSCEMIPDLYMYANSIVDGTESNLKSKMWLAIDEIRRQAEDTGSVI